MSNEVGIEIHVEAENNLAVGDVWPDGDAPDEITADAIKELMESSGSKRKVLREWLLDDDLDVTIVVTRRNPHWKQQETLVGPPPAEWVHQVARPWQ